jgi:hypothetical protein
MVHKDWDIPIRMWREMGMVKKKYNIIKVPDMVFNSIHLLQVEILLHGVNSFQAPWIRDLLNSGRMPPSKGNVIAVGIICLALLTSGKTKEEINQMHKEEVIAFLEKNGYSLPQKWSNWYSWKNVWTWSVLDVVKRDLVVKIKWLSEPGTCFTKDARLFTLGRNLGQP